MTSIQPSAPSSQTATGRRTQPVRAARRLFATILCLLCLYLTLCLLIAWETVRAKPQHLTTTPQAHSLPYMNIAFTSGDGTLLRGWLLPASGPPTGLIICCHGMNGTRLAMLTPALMLHHAGYAVMLFDFRARGESGGGRCTLGFRESDDVLAAIAYAHSRTDCRQLPIGLLGESMGGAVALMAAARSPHVRCVIAESPYARLDHAVSNHFRTLLGAAGPLLGVPTRRIGEMLIGSRCSDVAPIREIACIAPRPLLLIEDEDDQLCPPSETGALYAAAQTPKEIWRVSGADHIGAIGAQREEYFRHITAFFATNLINSFH